jgi:uncharacterized membrane protein
MNRTTHPVPIDLKTAAATERSAFETAEQPGLTLFAIGMIGLGVLALAVGDFAMVWQPVPPSFPARTALAYASGLLMMVCGAGLLFRATVKWSVRVLFPYCIAWASLKIPALVVAPKIEGVWLGFGELAVLLAGAWTLFANLGGVDPQGRFGWLDGDRSVRVARYWLAVWIIPIGLSHLIYAKETYALVPAWMPFRAAWVYITGVGQMASGLGLLFGVLPRVAAWAEAIQISLYTLLIWLPAVVFGGSKDLSSTFPNAGMRLHWTAFWISWAIASGAWVVAQNVRSPGQKWQSSQG